MGLSIKALDNHYLRTLLHSMAAFIQFQQRHNTQKISSTHSMTLKDHIKIIKALQSRDKKSSVAAIREHLRESCKFMLSLAE